MLLPPCLRLSTGIGFPLAARLRRAGLALRLMPQGERGLAPHLPFDCTGVLCGAALKDGLYKGNEKDGRLGRRALRSFARFAAQARPLASVS